MRCSKNETRFSDGYCYLRYVVWLSAELWEGDELQCRLNNELLAAIEALGRWPNAKTLFIYLRRRYPNTPLVELPMVDEVTCYYSHVPTVGIMMPFWALLAYYSARDDLTVGGDKVGKATPNSGAAIKALSAMGIDVHRMVLNATPSVRSDAMETVLHSAAVDLLSRSINANSGGRELKIQANLTSAEQAGLITGFSNFRLVFQGGRAHTHAYAYASRASEEETMLADLNYVNDTACSDAFDAKIVDIGGNWLRAFKRGRLHIHSCSPIIDQHDAQRATDRLVSINSMNRLTTTQQFLVRNNLSVDASSMSCKLFCLNKGQECRLRAPAAIFSHSVYDMTNKEIADCMDAHESMVGIATMMFDPDIVYAPRVGSTGTIPLLNAQWKIELRKSRRVVRFNFVGDNG